MEDRPPSRSAKIWRNHGDFAEGMHVEFETTKASGNSRVKNALKVMRKAYTQGSRYNQERY